MECSGVFSVPMRNWNPQTEPWVDCRPRFSAYLWGIETQFDREIEVQVPCFQRTYEELKHVIADQGVRRSKGFSAYLWGIETWYGFLFPLLMCRFQRTYEELKQMYNSICVSLPKVFSAYLWGIETLSSPGSCLRHPHRFQRTYEELKLAKNICPADYEG